MIHVDDANFYSAKFQNRLWNSFGTEFKISCPVKNRDQAFSEANQAQ